LPVAIEYSALFAHVWDFCLVIEKKWQLKIFLLSLFWDCHFEFLMGAMRMYNAHQT
jgi:hypothetical protein